jgi:hypothetical protein
MMKIPRSIKTGLDTEHFDIIRVMSLGHFYPVIVMRDKRSEARDLWCLQYRGSGYYFKTLRDMTSYCTKRQWQNPLSS